MMIRNGRNLEENAIFLLIGDYLDEKNYTAIHELIKDFHPADIAFLLDLLQGEDICHILENLSDDVQAEVIPELNDTNCQYIAEHMHPGKLPQIITAMDSDDAADLIGYLDKNSQEKLLKEVEAEDAMEVRELLQHEEDTAGGLMAKEVVTVDDTATVEEAITKIRKEVTGAFQIYNVFVVASKSGVLLGTLPLNILLLAKPDTQVTELMESTISVCTSVDQEEVARIAQKYNMIEVPVVDEGNRLVGRITHDDIMDVLEEEAEEDINKMAGTGDEEVFGHSAIEVSRKRLTWLIIGLGGGMLSALIISKFEIAIGEVVMLAFFVPVIMAMGGIVGLQCSTITVRGLATGEILHGQIIKRLIREVSITILTGLLCSLLLAVLVGLWKNDIIMCLAISGSMLFVMLLSTVSGTLIPVLLDRMKIDPAIATGPFVTTLNDVLGLTVYFTFTSFLIR